MSIVLVAERDESFRAMLVDYITASSPHTDVQATCGPQLVDKVKRSSPTLVIADVSMPCTLDALKRIREFDAKIPIYLSGSDAPPHGLEVDGYVQKNANGFFDVIDELLKKYCPNESYLQTNHL